jgi:hypothetical protein
MEEADDLKVELQLARGTHAALAEPAAALAQHTAFLNEKRSVIAIGAISRETNCQPELTRRRLRSGALC